MDQPARIAWWRHRWFALAMCALLTVLPTVVRAIDEPPALDENPVIEKLRELAPESGNADWEAQSSTIERALDNLWRRNGWNNESDRFARDVARDIASIPPWKPLKRLDMFKGRLVERYGLSEAHAAQLQATMLRESGKLLMKNAGVMLEQIKEGMALRSAGKPFTPEQVARWSKQSQPLLADVRASIERLRSELEPMLDPAHKRLFLQDTESYSKRERYVDAMTERWADGKWTPEDWGLQDDPVHAAAYPNANRSPGNTVGERKPKLPSKALAYDPLTWFVYVKQFGERLKLDPSQMTTAESVHDELFERAVDYAARHSRSLRSVPANERNKHELLEPIRSLYELLKSRLDAIPTSGQRERAGEE